MPNKRFLSPNRIFLAGRKSKVPEGGWTQEAFETEEGYKLNQDILAVTNAAKLKGSRMLTTKLSKVLKNQVKAVIARVKQSARVSYGIKGLKIAINPEAHEQLWAEAIEAELGREAVVEVERTVIPVMQSVSDDILAKTSVLLGFDGGAVIERVQRERVSEIARYVSGIPETTRNRMRAIVSRALDDSLTVPETIARMNKSIPSLSTSRVPTIVRTELGRAADAAISRSMRSSGVVTHMSVVGCEKIEPNIPTFRGVPTCNIINVPVDFSGSVEFHINHTGTWVASAFVRANGSRPDLPLRQGEGEGTFEERQGSRSFRSNLDEYNTKSANSVKRWNVIIPSHKTAGQKDQHLVLVFDNQDQAEQLCQKHGWVLGEAATSYELSKSCGGKCCSCKCGN